MRGYCPVDTAAVDVSLSSLSSGNFAVSLVFDGTTVSTKQIVKL